MGKGMLRGWQGPGAGKGVGRRRLEGGQEGWGWGGGQWGGRDGGGGTMGRGERGKRWGSGGRGWGGGDGNGERETGRWATGRGNWEGATGRGIWGRGISQMDIMKYLGRHMECLGGMRLQSFLTLFTRATPGTPAS